MIRIALVHPEIPQNTGNIGRLCVGLQMELHLIHPLGFIIDDKRLKRAGLDYWKDIKLFEHNSLVEFLAKHHSERKFFLTTKVKKKYTDVKYKKGDFLVMGCETKGLPEDLLEAYKESAITIPMPGDIRSLNISNATAVVAYEAFRQLGL